MEVINSSIPYTSNYQCSLCRLYFKSFGEMQKHLLKDHLLRTKNVRISLPWIRRRQDKIATTDTVLKSYE